MRRLTLILVPSLAVATALVSCSEDDATSDAPQAGNAGAAQGGAAGSGGEAGSGAGKGGLGGASGGAGAGASGGSGGDAQAGQGGRATAGTGPSSTGGQASGGAGGEGAGGAVDVCAGAVNATHSCASVRDTWAPQYDKALKRIELDVSSLPFKVVSGTLNYYFSDGNAHGCGQAQLVIEGDTVRASFQIQDIVPTLAGISLFSLTDECGATHVFELGSESSCQALQWSADVWSCTERAGKCIDQC